MWSKTRFDPFLMAFRAIALALPLVTGGVAVAQKSARPAAPTLPSTAAPINIDVAATRAELFGTDSARAAVAAAKLGQSRQPGALDALLDGLAMGFVPAVAGPAIDAVAEHRSPVAVDVLLHYARYRNADVRARATLALGYSDDKRAVAAWRAAFSDGDGVVRAAAAKVAAARQDVTSIEPLLVLLKKGDEASAVALAAMASADIARRVAELIGEAPDRLVGECLGAILLSPNLGKEEIYVEIVRAVGKIPGDEAVVALTGFIGATPEKPPRQSRREAQVLYEQRLGGDN